MREYSARVDIYLIMDNGKRYEVAQVAGSELTLPTGNDVPLGETGRLIIEIGDDTHTLHVLLASQDRDVVKFF